LIASFLLVALLPALPLSLVVHNLLSRSFGPAVDASLEVGLTAGLAQSRDALQDRKLNFLHLVNEDWGPRLGEESAQRRDNILVLDTAGQPHTAADVPAGLQEFATDAQATPLPLRVADVIRVGHFLAVALPSPDRRGATEVLEQADVPAQPDQREPGDHAQRPIVVLAQPLPDEMVKRAEEMISALGLVRTLRQDRERILLSYVAPFLVVYGLLIVLAVVAGALLARRIALPLEQLAAGTQRVAAGDLTTRVRAAASGEMATLIAAFNSMVERLAVQRRELARLERVAAWRDLARTLAHEIKNPLTPILLAVQSVKDAYRGDDREHAALLSECEQIVTEEVEGLRNLVREFSEFARLPQPRPVPGDLQDLVQEMVRLYGEERVLWAGPADPLPALIDTAELRRALINLIDNGLTACSEAGRAEQVTLTGGVVGQQVHLEVRDQGSGIAPENLPRIFEPNFSTKKEGMGLGLCVVESIVNGHGGGITVTRTDSGGTTFTIRLPRTESAAAPSTVVTVNPPDTKLSADHTPTATGKNLPAGGERR
jgi:signal transduction histidine kinase